MKRGRKTKPAEVKKLDGNPGRRPIEESELKPSSNLPRMPKGMPLPVQRFYKKYAPELNRLGLLTVIDLPAFIMMAYHYAAAKDAAAELLSYGTYLTGRDDTLVKNPATTTFAQHSSALRQYLNEFGMTPAARAGMQRGEGEGASLAQLLTDMVEEMSKQVK